MPRPRATDAQRNEQRERIRKAASEIYDSGGRAAVSVRAVAERAGTSQGTIYSYFTNLGELLRSLWAEPVAQANLGLEKIAGEVTDPVDRIRALLEAFVEFVLTNPDVHRGALMFVRPASDPTPERFPIEDVTFYRLVVGALHEAHEAGHTAIDDPHRSAELLWAALHGALALPFNADIYEVSEPAALAESMIDFLMAAITTKPRS